MKHTIGLKHEFVNAIPEELAENTLYISMEYATVAHKCCCGCGNDIVTPLGPTDWKLTYNGVTISLSPSVGNWSFPCRSHYWIHQGMVHWADSWSDERIASVRAFNRRAKEGFFSGGAPPGHHAQLDREPSHSKKSGGLWSWLSKLWSQFRVNQGP